jgi:hypothetical protein
VSEALIGGFQDIRIIRDDLNRKTERIEDSMQR